MKDTSLLLSIGIITGLLTHILSPYRPTPNIFTTFSTILVNPSGIDHLQSQHSLLQQHTIKTVICHFDSDLRVQDNIKNITRLLDLSDGKRVVIILSVFEQLSMYSGLTHEGHDVHFVYEPGTEEELGRWNGSAVGERVNLTVRVSAEVFGRVKGSLREFVEVGREQGKVLLGRVCPVHFPTAEESEASSHLKVEVYAAIPKHVLPSELQYNVSDQPVDSQNHSATLQPTLAGVKPPKSSTLPNSSQKFSEQPQEPILLNTGIPIMDNVGVIGTVEKTEIKIEEEVKIQEKKQEGKQIVVEENKEAIQEQEVKKQEGEDEVKNNSGVNQVVDKTEVTVVAEPQTHAPATLQEKTVETMENTNVEIENTTEIQNRTVEQTVEVQKTQQTVKIEEVKQQNPEPKQEEVIVNPEIEQKNTQNISLADVMEPTPASGTSNEQTEERVAENQTQVQEKVTNQEILQENKEIPEQKPEQKIPETEEIVINTNTTQSVINQTVQEEPNAEPITEKQQEKPIEQIQSQVNNSGQPENQSQTSAEPQSIEEKPVETSVETSVEVPNKTQVDQTKPTLNVQPVPPVVNPEPHAEPIANPAPTQTSQAILEQPPAIVNNNSSNVDNNRSQTTSTPPEQSIQTESPTLTPTGETPIETPK